MTTFADGLALSGRFAEFDALAAATAGWDLRFSKIGGSRFSGQLAMASTAEIQIAHETWSSGLLIEGAHPAGAVALAMVTAVPKGSVRWIGAEIEPTRLVFGGTPGHEVHFLTQGAAEVVTLCVEETLFRRHLLARFGIDAAGLGRDLSLHVKPGGASPQGRGSALNALRIALVGSAAASPEARRRLQDAALQIALDCLDVGEAARAVPLARRRRVAARAEEVLRSRLDDPPSLAELCRLVGSSERTLHLAFGERFGLPPKRWLRLLRLNAARRRLARCRGTVTEVAAELGFFHFARFAAEYCALFAELPSATLARARRQARPRAARR